MNFGHWETVKFCTEWFIGEFINGEIFKLLIYSVCMIDIIVHLSPVLAFMVH